MSDQDFNTLHFDYEGYKHTGSIITILDGTNEPRQIDLNKFSKNRITFGRRDGLEEPDIALETKYVSRMRNGMCHGFFAHERDKWFIVDNSSTNGILYNGEYIQKHELKDGHIFRINAKNTPQVEAVLFLVSSDAHDMSWEYRQIKDDKDITIGRYDDNSLVLDSPTVSRRHAVIKKNEAGWVIINESENGLLVNEKHIMDQCQLQEQDIICVASTKIIFTQRAIYVCSFKRGISVDARNVKVIRGKGKKAFVASNNVNMSIAPGELVAIVGGSGAGKSTIMNVLCGYLKPNEGSVYVNGNDLYKNFEALKKCFGYVPQSDIVYKNLSLQDMLQYVAELRLPKDMSKTERDENIKKVIRMVELGGKERSLIKKLSGGQQKRASIAVELLSDPKLLFLDEPMSGLDPGTERSLMKVLKNMTRAGKTIILVTHSTLHLSYCDKIAFMGKGGNLCFFGNEAEALHFFETKDIVEIYGKITEESSYWSEKYSKSYPPQDDSKQNGQQKNHITKRSEKQSLRQLRILSKRYIKLLLNDRKRLLILLLQAPLLALLISFVADGEQFKQYEMTKMLLFSLSCSGFWIGMFNAVQEICKEHTLLKREYMTGLSLSSYVFSKMIVLGILALIQSGLLLCVFSVMVGIPDQSVLMPTFMEMLLTAWLTTLSATAIALFVSSLFKNPDQALTSAPILVMLQILFSGLLFKLKGATEIVSWFVTCRWSMEGYGTTADLNSLQLRLQQEGILIPHEAEDFFVFSKSHLLFSWSMMIVFCIVFLMLARLFLMRIKKADD